MNNQFSPIRNPFATAPWLGGNGFWFQPSLWGVQKPQTDKEAQSKTFPWLPLYMERKINDYAFQNSYNETQRNLLANDLYKEALKQKNERDMNKTRQEVIRESYARSEQNAGSPESNQNKSNAKALEVVEMIRGYAKENGAELGGMNDMQVLQDFVRNNPETQEAINHYLAGDQSATDFAETMGFTPPVPQENWIGGTLKSMGVRNVDTNGILDYFNPIGKAAERIDDKVQGIQGWGDTSEREAQWKERIAQVTPEERKRYEEKFANSENLQSLYGSVDNYIAENKKGFWDHFWGVGESGPAVSKMIANAPVSALKTLSGTARAITNPLDSITGIVKILGTEEGRELLKQRYGENLAQTMNDDPVGLASDILAIIQAGAGIGAKGASLVGKAETASKLAGISQTAGTASDLGANLLHNKMMWGLEKVSNMGKVWNVVGTALEVSQEPLKVIGKMSEPLKEWVTRTIPEKVVENQMKLTPRERATVEATGITPAQFVLKENIGWLSKNDKVVALQNIANDAYKTVSDWFSKIPETEIIKNSAFKEMLWVMIDEMKSSPIVVRKYKDFIEILEKLEQADWYTPKEWLAIRRDFDAIVGKKIFDTQGRVSWLEDEIIAGYRATASDVLEEVAQKYWLEMKEQNSRIRNAITIRDGLLRSISQSKKNNYFGLQDLWVGAILWSADPVLASSLIIWKKAVEKFAPWISQKLFNLNKSPIENPNIKKWASFINKWWKNDSRFNLMNNSDSRSTSPQWQELRVGRAQNQILDSNFNQDAIDLHVHSRGYGSNDQQLYEQQTSQIEGSLWKNDEGVSWRVWLKWNIERSEGKDALTEEAIIEKYRQKAIKELWLPKWTTEINLAELMEDKKKYAKYQEITAEMQKELWYLWEDGYYTKKWYDDLESRKRKAYGEQKHTWRDDEGLDKLREWAETKYQQLAGEGKHGVANPLEKDISSQRATQIQNIRNGKSVEQIAKDYGVDIKIVDKITTPEGLRAYGKYSDGIITLADQIKEGTAPHELFHATFDLVDSSRKENILRQIEKSKGLDSLNAEEYLADSFSEYFRTGKFDTKTFGKGLVEKIKQYFYQVKQFITGANKNKAQIKKLFDEILDGEIDRDMLGEILGNKKETGTHRHQLGWPRLVPVSTKSSIMITAENASIFTKKLSNLNKVIKDWSFDAVDFLDGLKNNLNMDKKSGYLVSQKDWVNATLRISDHYANARNHKVRGYVDNNTSIVIKLWDSKFRANGSVDLVEFVYNPENLTPEKMQGIIKGVQDWIDTGEYTDKGYDHTHKSIRATLENGEVKYQRVYHGSPYEFDKFDSAHMGEGAGSQAHGWGHYVSIDKDIWKAYADPTQTPGENLRFKWIKGSLYEVEVPDPVKADTPTKSNYLYESRKLNGDELKQFYEHLKTNKRGNTEIFKEWIDAGHIGDGEDLYSALSYVLGWDKSASLFLRGMGYDGVSYYDVWDWHAYVIFDDNKLEIKNRSKL